MSQETIKQLKKPTGCAYPNCKNKVFANISLPVGEMTESGMINYPNEGKDTSIQSTAQLCEYHMCFAEQGLLRLVNQQGMIRLWGHFPFIEIAEGVFNARKSYLSKQLQKETKPKNAKRKTKKN